MTGFVTEAMCIIGSKFIKPFDKSFENTFGQ